MSSKTNEIFEEIVSDFIESLKKGENPFEISASTNPYNGATKRKYTGFNRIYLAHIAKKKGWDSEDWFTFKQALEYEGNVKKGEKGTPVFFWGSSWAFSGNVVVFDCNTREEALEKAKKKNPTLTLGDFIRKTMFIKHFTMFNRCQCDSLKEKDVVLSSATNNIKGLCSIVPLKETSGLPYYENGAICLKGGSEHFDWENEGIYTLLPLSEWASEEADLKLEFGEAQLTAITCSAFLAQAAGISSPSITAELVESLIATLEKSPLSLYSTASKAEKVANLVLTRYSETVA